MKSFFFTEKHILSKTLTPGKVLVMPFNSSFTDLLIFLALSFIPLDAIIQINLFL